MKEVTCEESDTIRPNLHPWSSLTNYIAGMPDRTDPRFPPVTRTEWADDDDVVRLIETNDQAGCKHEVPE